MFRHGPCESAQNEQLQRPIGIHRAEPDRQHEFRALVSNLDRAKLGFTYLRPIQVAYESPKFMLPIRLGTVNADGPQELFVLR